MWNTNLIITVPADVPAPDDLIQIGRRDLVKSRDTSSVKSLSNNMHMKYSFVEDAPRADHAVTVMIILFRWQ